MAKRKQQFVSIYESNQRKKTKRNNGLPVSNITGVTWYKTLGMWRVRKCVSGYEKHIGYYLDQTTAEAVKRALDLVVPNNSRLNF